MGRRQKHARNEVIIVEQAMLRSPAWHKLNGTAKDFYFALRMRCQLEDVKRNQKREVSPIPGKDIVNNGELVFPYRQAMKELEVRSEATIRSALDQLIDTGFVQVSEPGGPDRTPSRYSLVRDWELYGTESFKPFKRHKRQGWQWASGKSGSEPPPL